MRPGLLILGFFLLLVGFVWIGQGANVIGGSFMTGQTMWLEVGIGVALVGAAVLGWALVGSRRV